VWGVVGDPAGTEIVHRRKRPVERFSNMASTSGKRGTPRRGAYTASKLGVIGLTQVLAQELASHGHITGQAWTVDGGMVMHW